MSPVTISRRASPAKTKGKKTTVKAKGKDRPRTKIKLTAEPPPNRARTKVAGKPAVPSRRGAPAPAAPELLRHGQAWCRVLRRGQVLRLTDVTGNACVSALFYNARNPTERYNVADTLKAQYTAFLTTGRVLYSDMGRILVSIIADTCGWHDALGGCGTAAGQVARLGKGDYQTLGNDFHRNARDNFIVELGKVGLGKRDIVANVNFFARVLVDERGYLSWSPSSRPGAMVALRAEMDTLVVLSNTPHPLAPLTTYPPADVAVTLSIRAAEGRERPGPKDACRLSRPENERGFLLTEAYVAAGEAAAAPSFSSAGVP